MSKRPSEYCRLCNCCFKVKFGNISQPGKQGYLSSENLFKPSNRKDIKGVIIGSICKEVGLELVQNSTLYSDRVCNPCARKIRNLGELYQFVKGSTCGTSSTKRLLSTPDRNSPDHKTRRVNSPAAKAKEPPQSRKSLKYVEKENCSSASRDTDQFNSSLNIDDLSKEGLQIKVVLLNPNGKVIVRILHDECSKNVVKHICAGNWKATSNALLNHSTIVPELKKAMTKVISKEFSEYLKSGSILQSTSVDELAAFTNKILMEEIRVFCPFWYAILLGATGLEENDMKKYGTNANATALATSTLIRVRNNTASALHYRVSTILFHSGTKFEDLIRLNRLGVCMSPNAVLRAQRKMCEQLEGKVKIWKKAIEENKSSVLLCKEIKQNQVPGRSETEMEIGVDLDVTKERLQQYDNFTCETYSFLRKLLDSDKERMCEPSYTEECLDEVINNVETTRLPLYKLVGDNRDHEIFARVQSKDHGNRSIHVLDRVQDPNLEGKISQKPVSEIQFVELLPGEDVQANLLQNWAIIVSRVITKYLKPFHSFRHAVIRHIPHAYSKEMSEKSNIVMLSWNGVPKPNVSGEMAQLLQHNQDRYVPCLTKGEHKTVLTSIPLHGDQLFEERARNVIWTFIDGANSYDKLDGIDTEFADWHAKYTLYKLEYKMFVDHSSAGEIGTTRASINRTGKTNAAKGVENHFNEYSEFHAREIEAHICAAFMEITGMKSTSDTPNIILTDSTECKNTKAKWLLEICEDLVKKCVFNTDKLRSLVQQTADQQQAQKQTKWICRSEECEATYALHSNRVRHEIEKHNLSFDNGNDIQDCFGYFYCRVRCGEVFKTKTTRNRHEERKHDQKITGNEVTEENVIEDYTYNYHSAKLTFGLILMEFKDAVKEGDGQRLFDLYKLAQLLYKSHGHYKYAYAVLMYLVKCIAILPKRQALSCKWNRFYNGSSMRGKNIPLDLKKEQQNRILKTMWRALGSNLDEVNAERTAGTLESLELIYQSIDKDCVKEDGHANRGHPNEEEAVEQIISDLINNKAFKRINGRDGYPSFPKFQQSLFHGLDYRDLHKWLKEHIDLWGSIYQQS